jgi:type II secretory pathway pseudopilin PulG
MSRNIHRNNKGQSIIEFLVALGIMVIVAGGGTTIIIGSLRANKNLESHIEALGLANEGIEAAKSIKNQDWDNMINGTYGLDDSAGFWSFLPSPNLIKEKYSREVIIEDAEIAGDSSWEVKKITSAVTWNQIPTRTERISNILYLSNWRTARAVVEGGPAYGTCNDYCASIGYEEGNCQAFPLICWIFGKDYIPYGSQFCLGGTWRDTCCCE